MNLSVIIPSRNFPDWPFLQKTVDDLFEKAETEVEVIVIEDGFALSPCLKDHKNLTVVLNPEVKGMRYGINLGAKLAKGKFIMKCDDHCMFGQGYDKILTENCDDDWLTVPSRYALDGEKWLRKGDDKPWKYGPVEYLYLTYPFNLDDQFGFGFHGKKWRGEHGFTGGYFGREKARKGIEIDDMLTFQGSCWLMPKALFWKNGGMQEAGYYQHQEAQELGFKVWLSGGRCVLNKKTWYAHLHKGNLWSRGYHLLKHQMIKSQAFSCDLWMNNRWPGQVRPLKWLVEHPSWWPLELWPEDWDNPDRWKGYDYTRWQETNKVQRRWGKDFITADELRGQQWT